MKYASFSPIYPPRPDRKVPVQLMAGFERDGWIAQVKKKGSRNVIYVAPPEGGERKVLCMNRHKEPHKQWSVTDDLRRLFQRLPGPGWYVFDAELLHAKTPHIKNTNYIFDLLVDDGELLVGKTLPERRKRLEAILRPLTIKRPVTLLSHREITDNLWLANHHTSGFIDLFKRLVNSEDEGLVLKNPKVPLGFFRGERNNDNWQVKCRKPTKNVRY